MSFDQRSMRIEAADGNSTMFAMPESSGRIDAQEKQFDRIAKAISEAWKARVTPPHSNQKARRSDLERACYHLITWCLEKDLVRLLKRRAKIKRHKERKIAHRSEVFHVGLDAIFERQRDGLTANQRARLVREMWFAFRHYIPEFMFVGFIHQCGGSVRIAQLGVDHILPDFREWVIERRTNDGLLQRARGSYDAEIQRAVRAKRRALVSSNRIADVHRTIALFAGLYEGRRRQFVRNGDYDLGRALSHEIGSARGTTKQST